MEVCWAVLGFHGFSKVYIVGVVGLEVFGLDIGLKVGFVSPVEHLRQDRVGFGQLMGMADHLTYTPGA